MKRFKHILAATDLSSESMSAVQYAAHLAQAQNARLTVLHVAHSLSLAYAEFVPPVSMADIDLAIEKSAREELEKWVRSHLKKVPRVGAVVRRGVTHEVIADVAEEIGASVVVVATHGQRCWPHGARQCRGAGDPPRSVSGAGGQAADVLRHRRGGRACARAPLGARRSQGPRP